MTVFARKLAFSLTAACFVLTLGATPALAKTTHHKHHTRHHHVKAKSKLSKSSAVIRIAQDHLAHLGYYSGKVDGVMGPRTRTAIKNFQKDKGLKVDGVLGPMTNRALADADKQVIGTHSFMTHDVVNSSDAGIPIDPDYAYSMNGQTKTISSRFGSIDVNESGTGADKRYNVNLNGQSLLTIDGQPSVIGVSPTYDMGSEEAVVFSTYSPTDANCMYKTHVLALNNAGTQMLDIDNCTRAYQARVDNGSLFISFPEHDDNRAIGATYRLEGMSIQKL